MQTSTTRSPAAVLDAASTLAPVIAANGEATEANRQLAPAVVAGIRAAGLQRLTLTEENGGLEIPLPAALEVYERLAGADASVGWIVWNNALPCLFSRFLSPATRADVFADPDWLHASSTRPSGTAVRETDGYRLSGRWSLVSGCELAEWMPVTGLVATEDGEPEMRYFFLRRSELEILDTWHVGGLRGTGSHDVVVNDLLVPDARCVAPATDPSTASGPYGRIPIIGTLSLGMAAQFLGIARSALTAVIDQATTTVSPSPVPDMRDRPDVQRAIASHSAALAAARAHLYGQADIHWQRAQAGDPAGDPVELAPLFAASSHAIQTVVTLVDELYSLSGTQAIYRDSPLERISRDLRVMRQHVLTQSLWPEQSGRVMLGLSVDNPLYAI